MIRNIIEAVILIISVAVLLIIFLRQSRQVDDLDGAELVPAEKAGDLEDEVTFIASDYMER